MVEGPASSGAFGDNRLVSVGFPSRPIAQWRSGRTGFGCAFLGFEKRAPSL